MIVVFTGGYKLKQVKAKKILNLGDKFEIITDDNKDIVVNIEYIHYILNTTT